MVDMEKRLSEIKYLRPGGFCIIDDVPCKVESIDISKPGKHGGAKARLSTSGIFDGNRRIIVKPADSRIDVPVIEKRDAQILSVSGDYVQVMDLEDFSNYDVKKPDDIELQDGDEVLIWRFGVNVLIKQKKTPS